MSSSKKKEGGYDILLVLFRLSQNLKYTSLFDRHPRRCSDSVIDHKVGSFRVRISVPATGQARSFV